MHYRQLVRKEKAKEVSVEHVDLNKIYVIDEADGPILVALDRYKRKVIYTGFTSRPIWLSDLHGLMPDTPDYIPPHEILARAIDWVIKEKGKKVCEFRTLAEFCSWMLASKDKEALTPKPMESVKKSSKKVEKYAKGDGRYIKLQHPEHSYWSIHYASRSNEPICGSTLAWPNNWRRVTGVVTCQKCAYAFRHKTEGFRRIATKR